MTKKLLYSLIIGILSLYSLKGQQSEILSISIESPQAWKNIFNESANRNIYVYLPPSYNIELSKKYPVVYFLGGFGTYSISWTNGDFGSFDIKTAMDRLITSGTTKEMIVVVIDGLNYFDGSFYDNSELTGNWEDYITKTIVGYLDNNYRTIADKNSRALAGHSMGGYGALNLSMKNPDIFSVGFGMNPGLFSENGMGDCQMFATQDAIDTYFSITDYLNTVSEENRHSEYIRILNEMKSGWDPNVFTFAYGSTFGSDTTLGVPYFKYPYSQVNDELVLDTIIWKKWDNGYGNLKNKVEQYKENLSALNAYVIDCGIHDFYTWIPEGCNYYSELLTENNIKHQLNLHNGDHGNMVGTRFETVLIPLCDTVLEFDTTKTYYFGEVPPEKDAKIFAPGIISLDDRFEQAFCYGVMDSACFISTTDNYWSHFTMERKSISDTGWSVEHTPVFLTENGFGLTPVFHPIEKKVYFPSSGDIPETTDIFMSEKENGIWSAPKKCETPLNSNRSDWHLSFTNSGTMYFSSDRTNGLGGIDIYKMEYKNGEYTNLENMGAPINTSKSDCTPLISPEGDYMIIESTRSNDWGVYDLYVSFKKDDGSWYEPISLGSSVNTNHHDMAPAFSPDMKYLFFTRRDSQYPASFSDIYWISLDIIQDIKDNLPPNWHVGVNEKDNNNHLQIYPNPGQNKVKLISPKTSYIITNCNIYDTTGKLKAEKKVENNIVDISDLNKGMYVLVLDFAGELISEKLVVD